MHIAFVTSEGVPDLTPDDRLAATALAARGAVVSAAQWSDASIEWNAFNAVIVRSTWDYHRRADEFAEWIGRAERLRVALWNPGPLLRWNMHKSYLRELDAAGVPVVPTAWVARGNDTSLRKVIAERGWTDVVVKPMISATAHKTVRASLAEVDAREQWFSDLLATGDVMVQPFMKEVQRSGEWSLIFIDGEFSHAMRKRPRANDFRVQSEFGGTAVAEEPSPRVRDAARRVLDAVEGPWLYARVDGLETDAGFMLLELEMLEPSLFLGANAGAAERFADAILRLRGTT